jgi:hypothetical protein
MPYENHWTENGLYRKFTGTVSGMEIFKSNTELHGDARFDELQYILNDFTTIDNYDICDVDINLIANSDKVSQIVHRNVKVAIVVDKPELYDWVDKYFLEIGQAAFDCRLFHNCDEAKEWIES